MSDIVNAFKQKSSRKRANWQSEDTNPIQELQLKRQDNTVQQETQENKALKASQQQNVQQNTDTYYSQKLAALQEAAAAEQAQNAANAAAQQQAQQQTQQTQQVVKQDNEGWKKYYDSEKQKVREQASKANAFDTFLQDLFNSGWDTRLAETQARNKYAQEMLRQSTDDSGNVTDQNKLNEVRQFTNYNADVAKANSDYEKARGNMIGATAQNKDQNMFKSTANAIRNMDVGSAILGSRDVEGTEGAKSNNIKDAGRFLLNLLPGMANAPTTGLTNLSEALSGKGTNYETGLEEDLDTLSRVGRGASGAIDVAGLFYGPSKDLINSVSKTLFKRGANEAVKQATKQTTKGAIKELTKAMLQEGGEEATQQIAEFFGNGGKLITSDGQFDQESFNDLVKETAQAGALGAVGGGIFHGTAKGIDALRNKTKVPKVPNAGVAESSDISNINNQKISAQTRNEKAAEQLRNLEGSVVKNTTEKTDTKVNEPVDITETTYQPSERLTSAISKINEVQKSQSNLPQNTINDINTQVQNISEQIRNGEITEEDGIRMIEELKTSLQTTTENNVVEPQETSATGQKVNPQDVSNVVTEAQGTQANQTPADVKTDVTENTPKLSEKMSEPAKKEQARIIENLNKTGLSNEDISEISQDTGRGLRDIYAVTQANTKGKFAIDQAVKKGDTNFVKNLIKKYLREGTYDKEISRFRETMPSIYGAEGNIDFGKIEYEPTVDESGYRSMRKIDNPRLDALKTKIQEAKNNGRITPETIEYIKQEISSNKTTDEKIANIEKIFEPVEKVEQTVEYTPEQEITDLINTAAEETTAKPITERVGNITENYLQDKEYTVEDMRDLSNRINSAAEAEANELGTTMNDIRREVNRAERANLKTLDETELTPEQQDLYRRYLNELNSIRAFGESQGKQIAGDIGELYMPNQMLGWQENNNPLGGFNTEKPGSEISRGENRISVEEQDFGTDPIDRYFIEHGASNAVKQERAKSAISNITGNENPSEASVKEYIKLQEDINSTVTKNPLKVSQKSESKTKVSPSETMFKIGEENGVAQQPIYGKAHGLTDEDKLKSVEVVSRTKGKDTVWNAGGYYAYRQAPSWAATVRENTTLQNGNINDVAFKSMAKEYLSDYGLDIGTQQYLEQRIDNINQFMSPKAKEVVLSSIFRDAARNKNIQFLASHKIENDSKLQKVVDNQSTIMLRDNSIEKSAATKLTSGILKLQNAAFRKMNFSSAMNELSDLTSMMSVTGKDFKPYFKKGIASKYGMTEAEIDPAVMAEVTSADGVVDNNKLKTFIKKLDKGTNLYHFVEQYKMNVALSAFEDMGIRQGLSGKELTNFVTDNTRKIILPVDQFTRTFLNDYPLFTQYMPWTLRNLQKEGQLLIGSYEGGVYETGNTLSKNRLARIGYNAVTNLPLKTLYWLSSNALKATTFATALGLLELGVDFSGVEDEDKNIYEKYISQITGASTIGSLINSVEYALHKEDLKNQYANEDYNPYENENLGSTLGDLALTHFVPAGGQIKKDAQSAEMLGKGYSENKADKVQYLSPDNPIDVIKSLLFGKSSTGNAREYSGNLDLMSRVDDKVQNGSDAASAILSSIIDMAKEDSGLQDRDYNRPLSNSSYSNYNQKVKESMENGDRTSAEDWYAKGQAYNEITDTLRKNNPDAYEVYQSTFNKELVSPERYARIAYGNGEQNPEAIDLTVWNTMKDLAVKRKEDFGTDIDPAYTELDDEQTRRYLQYKSTATGDDLILKKEMSIDPFWDEFFDKQTDYYNRLGSDFNTDSDSQRVKEWNNYNTQYGDYMKFISGNTDTMKDQQLALELSLQFPLMKEYQSLKTALQSKYGDEYKSSTEYKSFWSNNYDAYQAESEAFNSQVLYLINQMRTIEGYDEMTLDQLEAINQFGKESSSSYSGKKSSGSSSSGGYSYAPSFENTFQATPVYAKNYSTKKSVKAKKAGKANFENVSLSGTSGTEPYAAV